MNDSSKIDRFRSGDIEEQIEALAEQYLSALQAGEAPDVQPILTAHPQIAEPLGRRLALVARLFRAAENMGDRKRRRIPAAITKRIKCPHCGNGVQLVEPIGKELTCTGCGSSFHVDPDATLSYRENGPGVTIGRFEVLELAGRGAFGEVYKARDPELDRIVAIKIPRVEYFTTPEEEQRFLREARSAAGLRHSSIVQVHHIEHDRGLPYIVSDYIEGLTLADLISGGRPDFRESTELIATLADAVDYAHRQKVIHRDIKPSNILLQTGSAQRSVSASKSQFTPYLTDFGLARRDDAEITVTLDGQVLGTPAYMSPEQAKGDHATVDGRTDVYSLGVVFYELLTGELPFRGTKRMLLHQVLNDEPRNPRTLNDRIPRDLETICLKAMAKEPGRRYETASEFANDLRRYLHGDPIHARPVGRVERLYRWARRNPVVAALTSVAIMLLTGLAVVMSIAWVREQGLRAEEHRQRIAAQLSHEKEVTAREDEIAARMEQSKAELQLADARLEQAANEAALTRGHLHHTQTLLLGPAFDRQDGRRSIELLRATAPKSNEEDLRGFEWYYYFDQLHRERLTLRGHKNAVEMVAFSPDGKTLASTSSLDAEVRTWGVDTGAVKSSFDSSGGVFVVFSPDGQFLVESGVGAATVWNPITGEKLTEEEVNDSSSVFTDGRFLAWGFHDDQSFALRHIALRQVAGTATQHQRFPFSGKSFRMACFSPDGESMATFDQDSVGNSVRLWDITTSVESSVLKGGSDPRPTKMIFSPDGASLAISCDFGTIKVWDVATGNEKFLLAKHTGKINDLVFSPDGKRLASCGVDRSVWLWDATTGEDHFLLRGHVADVNSIAFSPDSQWLASASDDSTVRLWNVVAGREQTILRGHAGGVNHVTFSPDGSNLASAGSDGTIRLWETERLVTPCEILNPVEYTQTTSGVESLHETQLYGFMISGDGHKLLAANQRGPARLWDVDQMEILAEIPNRPSAWPAYAMLPDGKSFSFAGESNGSIHFWSMTDGKQLGTSIHMDSDSIWDLAASPDGQTLAAGSDSQILLLDTASGAVKATLRGHNSDVDDVYFSPDGKTLASIDDNSTIKIWDLASLAEKKSIDVGTCCDLDFSPDGKTLVYADGANIRLIDRDSGQTLSKFEGHSQDIYDLAFSADGLTLASASEDGTVKIWDLPTSIERATFSAGSVPVVAVAFTPDGETLISGQSDGRIHFWHKATTQKVDRRMAEYEAFDLVKQLGRTLLLREEIVQAIQENEGLRPLVREQALGIAAQVQPTAIHLNDAAWNIVRPLHSSTDPAQVARALRYAAEAMRLDSSNSFRSSYTLDDGKVQYQPYQLNTLGVSQYRAGHFEKSLQTLRESERLIMANFNPDNPAAKNLSDVSIAFQAMALYQLGRVAEAQSAFERVETAFLRVNSASIFETAYGNLYALDAGLEAAEIMTPWGKLLGEARRHYQAEQYSEEAAALKRAIGMGCAIPLIMNECANAFAKVREKTEAGRFLESAFEHGLTQSVPIDENGLTQTTWINTDILNEMVSPGISNWRLILFRARQRAAAQSWKTALDDVRRAQELGADVVLTLPLLATCLRNLEQWTEASEPLRMLSEQSDASPQTQADRLYQAALCQLAADNLPGYRDLCTEMLRRFGDTEDPIIAARILYTLTPGSDAVTAYDQLIQLARKAAAPFDWDSRLVGATLFRAGQFEQVEQQFEASRTNSTKIQQRAWDFYFLAMTCHHLKKSEQADAYFKQANDWYQEYYSGVPWTEQIEMRRLRKEAEALLSVAK